MNEGKVDMMAAMGNSTQTDQYQMRALQERERIISHNLMDHGPGTPWEDRGSGMLSAYIRTCIQSLTAPAKLYASIRRPETTIDATWLAAISGIMWGASWVIHSYILFRMNLKPTIDPSSIRWDLFWILSALQFVIAPIACVLLLRICAGIYGTLVSTEMRTSAPSTLVYNMLAYCLAPSILAPLPYWIGPVLAGTWILVLMLRVGASRLFITTKGSVIAAILSLLAVGLLGGAIYTAGHLARQYTLDELSITETYKPNTVVAPPPANDQ